MHRDLEAVRVQACGAAAHDAAVAGGHHLCSKAAPAEAVLAGKHDDVPALATAEAAYLGGGGNGKDCLCLFALLFVCYPAQEIR